MHAARPLLLLLLLLCHDEHSVLACVQQVGNDCVHGILVEGT